MLQQFVMRLETVVKDIMIILVTSQLLHVHSNRVEKVASVDHNTVVPLETDLGLKLGIGSHQIKLGVDSHTVTETRETDTRVPGSGHVISIITVGHPDTSLTVGQAGHCCHRHVAVE